MKRLPEMEYRAEFIRGWPSNSSLEMNYSTDDATLTNGDLVIMTADMKVKRCNAEHGAGVVGIVVRGPADSKSVRVAGGLASGNGKEVAGNGNTCIILWGHYIVRTINFDDTKTYAAGTALSANATGKFGVASGANVLGHVLEISSLNDGKKALVVLVR